MRYWLLGLQLVYIRSIYVIIKEFNSKKVTIYILTASTPSLFILNLLSEIKEIEMCVLETLIILDFDKE